MPIMLLDDAVKALVRAGTDPGKNWEVLSRVVGERVHVMHERAQVAEGQAATLRRRLARLSEFVGSGAAFVAGGE